MSETIYWPKGDPNTMRVHASVLRRVADRLPNLATEVSSAATAAANLDNPRVRRFHERADTARRGATEMAELLEDLARTIDEAARGLATAQAESRAKMLGATRPRML